MDSGTICRTPRISSAVDRARVVEHLHRCGGGCAVADGNTTRKPRRTRKVPAPTTPDPIEIAMEAEAFDTALDSPARRLLIKQERLVDAQLTGERLSNALKMLGGLAGLAAAAALALMAWTASRAHGVVIEAFSVPPALAQRGLTGEAVARRLMDDITAISEQARSAEERRGLSGGFEESLSIEIPETGISIGEVEKWLRSKLGHETRITGEVTAAPDGGLTLASRTDSRGLPVQAGGEKQLAEMTMRAAESIVERSQPVTYGLYLFRADRYDDLLAFAKRRTRSESARERANGYIDLGNVLSRTEGNLAAAANFRLAIEADPTADIAYGNLSLRELNFGHPQAAYDLRQQALRFEEASRDRNAKGARKLGLDVSRARIAEMTGDWSGAVAILQGTVGKVFLGFIGPNNTNATLARAHAAMHDIRRARAELALFDAENPEAVKFKLFNTAWVAMSAEDWPGVITNMDALIEAMQSDPDRGEHRPQPRLSKALALARLGRMDEAQTLIATTPLDCQPCIGARGTIAALAGDPKTADHWFSEAVRMAPSIPFANTDWGQALLARGDTAGAIARFSAAHRQSPRFADPIEMWGEALLRQGDAKAALAKFREADKYAPNWGRNHLMWAEALTKLGRADEAKAQRFVASRLDLTANERVLLVKAHGGDWTLGPSVG